MSYHEDLYNKHQEKHQSERRKDKVEPASSEQGARRLRNQISEQYPAVPGTQSHLAALRRLLQK